MAERLVTRAAAALLLATGAYAPAQSLYESDTYRPLATDLRAHEVGDILTVLIFESASATSHANTTADRTSTLDVRATDLHNTIGGAYTSNNEFEGGGTERRTGEVIARVSVTVTEVLPNGDLVVQGEQHIELNNEAQRIYVAGRLRPEDILADNSALSSRLADAQIEFKGRGLLSSRERPGLVIRFFQWLF
jgi:flagellar L-ring protein FlgH